VNLHSALYQYVVPELDLADPGLGITGLDIPALDNSDVHGCSGSGSIGFDWILFGLGVFADMVSNFSSYAERRSIPYGDRIPTYYTWEDRRSELTQLNSRSS